MDDDDYIQRVIDLLLKYLVGHYAKHHKRNNGIVTLTKSTPCTSPINHKNLQIMSLEYKKIFWVEPATKIFLKNFEKI